MKRAAGVDHRDEHVIGIECRPGSAVVADHHPEIHIAIGGWKCFTDSGRSGEQVRVTRKDPLRTDGGIPGSEQRACPIIAIVHALLSAQIALLPAVRQRIAYVGIGTGRGEHKRGGRRNRVIGTGIHRRYAVSCVGDRRGRIGVSVGDLGNHLIEAHRMEVGVAVGLQIVATHDARIAHDRRRATRFHRSAGVAVAIVAVEGVIGAELMAHFVSHIVDIERVTDRRSLTGHAASLTAAIPDDTESRHAPTAGAEDVPDIVIGVADYAVYIRLVFAQHRKTIVIAIRIRRSVRIDELVIVGDENHAGCDVGLIDAIDPIHGRHDCRHGSFHSSPMVGGVFSGTRDRQVVGPQLRSVREQGADPIVVERPLVAGSCDAKIAACRNDDSTVGTATTTRMTPVGVVQRRNVKIAIDRYGDCTIGAAATAGMIPARFVILQVIDADIV